MSQSNSTLQTRATHKVQGNTDMRDTTGHRWQLYHGTYFDRSTLSNLKFLSASSHDRICASSLVGTHKPTHLINANIFVFVRNCTYT
jgi:hypothetical protein